MRFFSITDECQNQRSELRSLLFAKGVCVFNVPCYNHVTLKMQETGPTIFSSLTQGRIQEFFKGGVVHYCSNL